MKPSTIKDLEFLRDWNRFIPVGTHFITKTGTKLKTTSEAWLSQSGNITSQVEEGGRRMVCSLASRISHHIPIE